MNVASTSIADIVADYAEEIASAMAIYHTEAAGSKARSDIIKTVEGLRERFDYEFLRLSLRHKAEAFEAEAAQRAGNQ